MWGRLEKKGLRVLVERGFGFGYDLVLWIPHAEMNRLGSFAGEGDAESFGSFGNGEEEPVRAMDQVDPFGAKDSDRDIGRLYGPRVRSGVYGQEIEPGTGCRKANGGFLP